MHPPFAERLIDQQLSGAPMTDAPESQSLFSRPRLSELGICILVAVLGTLLGIAINTWSPRGFDMKLAAGVSNSQGPQ